MWSFCIFVVMGDNIVIQSLHCMIALRSILIGIVLVVDFLISW